MSAGAPDPLRTVVVGAGGMGSKWLGLVHRSAGTVPVAVVDLDTARAAEAVRTVGADGVQLASELGAILAEVEADILVNTTVPAAHHEVSRAAMEAGLDVVSEKPAADSLADGLRLAAVARATGRLLSVSQSRRHTRHVRRLARAAGELAPTGAISCSFARGPRFGGFREEMEHPLLLDMAIHPFDTARLLTGAKPRSVLCLESNPPWSWYKGAAEAVAVFELDDGSQFSYHGSWCSLGEETSWNGAWRVETPQGSLLWDGDSVPRLGTGTGSVPLDDLDTESEGIAAGLDQLVAAVRGGPVPDGVVIDNLGSLAMVEAAVLSAERRAQVSMAEVWEQALEVAQQRETDRHVRELLPEVVARASG
ncbi:Gfo/Idh/MocA family protein [Desertihabitans aurantiacus]|uniref:Gfo/Idh/MocA family protein n=1 Tax=Desertihabitans aurantiacus TaxID=2282477 RepID=UPI000DF766D7|nr:Gfo/Idh/MocA family oxidoreductase [Desertihabitans aurantiacus]